MRYSNLHTHSIYSDGGNTIEENILAAIDKNFVSIGMSDHSHVDAFDCTYDMRTRAEAAYFREISALKEKYEGKIEIYTGIELEGFSELKNREQFDYIIGDNHYNIGDDGRPHEVDYTKELQTHDLEHYFNNDPLLYAEKYYDLYYASQKKHKPDILGHYDLISIFGNMPEDDQRYKDIAIDHLKECLKICPIVELNTGAIKKGLRSVPYPHPFLLEEIKNAGGKIVLSSDCHMAENLDFNFDKEIERLKSIGFKSIVQLIGGKFTEVGI